MTDGYNVTPNFFISAEIDPEYDYTKSGVKQHKANDGKNYAVSRHFENHLFDRDTLLLALKRDHADSEPLREKYTEYLQPYSLI